jgi:CheY-like chemotaxis protein
LQTKQILVVDDDPDIVDYFGSFLRDHGYEVFGVNGSTSALEALEKHRPDAILVDVLMPGRSGLDLLVTIRRDERWSDIPVVVVTGSDKILEDDCQSYFGSHQGVRGPYGVLGKPVDRKALLAILKRLTGA